MAAAREGMELAKTAQRTREKFEPGIYTAPARDDVGVQGGARAVQFRRKFNARDPYDDQMNLVSQLSDKDGMTPFGQVFWDDKKGRWLERKAAVAEAANFDEWFNKEYNKNDLASRQFAQEINPEFYAQREREMDEKAEMVLKVKKMQLRGPQSEEETYMQWLIHSGRVPLPGDWDRIGPVMTATSFDEQAKKKQEYDLSQGLIRRPLFMSPNQREVNATNNRSAAVGLWGSDRAAKSSIMGMRPDVPNMPLQRPEGEPNMRTNDSTYALDFSKQMLSGFNK